MSETVRKTVREWKEDLDSYESAAAELPATIALARAELNALEDLSNIGQKFDAKRRDALRLQLQDLERRLESLAQRIIPNTRTELQYQTRRDYKAARDAVRKNANELKKARANIADSQFIPAVVKAVLLGVHCGYIRQFTTDALHVKRSSEHDLATQLFRAFGLCNTDLLRRALEAEITPPIVAAAGTCDLAQAVSDGMEKDREICAKCGSCGGAIEFDGRVQSLNLSLIHNRLYFTCICGVRQPFFVG